MPGKAESILKNFPRKPNDPCVVIEKLVLPSSQPPGYDTHSDTVEILNEPLGSKKGKDNSSTSFPASYAEAATNKIDIPTLATENEQIKSTVELN